MLHANLYRTCVAAALLGASGLLMTGCESWTNRHDTQKEEQYGVWNATRLGVVLQLATQQYEVGDYDKCRESLKEAFSFKQPSADLEILAAKVELEKGTLDKASEYLKTAVQIDAKRADAYYLLGVVYQRWQKLQVAHDYYKLAWDIKSTEALYLLAMVEMKISLGQYDEARQLLEEKMVYFEQTAAIRVALARLATFRGDFDQATKYYRDATLLAPDDLSLRQTYAEALYFAGKYRDALAVLEDLRMNPDLPDKTSLLSILGQTYQALHRTRDACECFAELTRTSPHLTAAWIDLGKATLQMDDYAQAAAIAKKVLKDEPANVQAMILLALSQHKLRQWDAAQATLEKANRIAPKDTTVLCLLGISMQHAGRNEQAVKLYAAALEISPANLWAQELLSSAKPAAVTPPVPAPSAPQAPVAPAAPVEPAPATPDVTPALPAPDAPAARDPIAPPTPAPEGTPAPATDKTP